MLGKNINTIRKSIQVYLRELVWEGMDWMHLTQDRDQCQVLVRKVIEFWVP
jgi:hypothetical protein